MNEILEAFKIILELSGEADDEGANALMSDYIIEQQKLDWMYASYVSK